jgi:phosphoglycerate dehydrogenase-like enzyme
VVLTIPSTTDTVVPIGRKELQAMKSSAYLINIARDSVIDEPALLEALRNATISGARLDTLYMEGPLPPDSPFCDLPNVIISSISAAGWKTTMKWPRISSVRTFEDSLTAEG